MQAEGFGENTKTKTEVLTPETRDRIVCMPGWDKFHDLCLARASGPGPSFFRGVGRRGPVFGLGRSQNGFQWSFWLPAKSHKELGTLEKDKPHGFHVLV